MVPYSYIIFFVGLLCALSLIRFSNYVTTYIDHLGLNLGRTFEIIKHWSTVVFILIVHVNTQL